MSINDISTINISLGNQHRATLKDWLAVWELVQNYRGTSTEQSLRESLDYWALRIRELNDARIAWDKLPKFDFEVARKAA